MRNEPHLEKRCAVPVQFVWWPRQSSQSFPPEMYGDTMVCHPSGLKLAAAEMSSPLTLYSDTSGV